MSSWKKAIEAYREHCEKANPDALIDPMAMYGNNTAVFQKSNGYRVYIGAQPNDVSTSEDVEAMLKQLGVPADEGWN